MNDIFEVQGNTKEALRVAAEIEERLPKIADALRELVTNGTTTIAMDICRLCDETSANHCPDCEACFDDHSIDCPDYN